MRRFEVLDASSCMGEQYVVQRGTCCYYVGPDRGFARALADHLEAVVPRWEVLSDGRETWIHARSGDFIAAARLNDIELKSAGFPMLAIGKAIEEIDYELYKLIADEFKSR